MQTFIDGFKSRADGASRLNEKNPTAWVGLSRVGLSRVGLSRIELMTPHVSKSDSVAVITHDVVSCYLIPLSGTHFGYSHVQLVRRKVSSAKVSKVTSASTMLNQKSDAHTPRAPWPNPLIKLSFYHSYCIKLTL